MGRGKRPSQAHRLRLKIIHAAPVRAFSSTGRGESPSQAHTKTMIRSFPRQAGGKAPRKCKQTICRPLQVGLRLIQLTEAILPACQFQFYWAGVGLGVSRGAPEPLLVFPWASLGSVSVCSGVPGGAFWEFLLSPPLSLSLSLSLCIGESHSTVSC